MRRANSFPTITDQDPGLGLSDWTQIGPGISPPPPPLPQYRRQGMGHDVDFLVLVQTGPEVPHDLPKHLSILYTANEWPVRIQYKCLVPTYVFPETVNCAALLFPKQNYNVLSTNFHSHVPVSDLYIPRIGLLRTDHGNI